MVGCYLGGDDHFFLLYLDGLNRLALYVRYSFFSPSFEFSCVRTVPGFKHAFLVTRPQENLAEIDGVGVYQPEPIEIDFSDFLRLHDDVLHVSIIIVGALWRTQNAFVQGTEDIRYSSYVFSFTTPDTGQNVPS